MFIELTNEDKIEIEELWQITDCIICQKNLTLKNELSRSKLLPCLHAMCYKCFVKCCEKGELVCPCCSFSFNKEEIYDNKVLYEVVSDVKIPKTKNIVCSIHDSRVSHWCENCNEFICPDCVKHHGQLKSTKTHTIITKDNYICKLLSGTPKIAFPCEVHPQNELSIICHSCQAMTCRDCQLEHHKDHKYDFIVDKADSAKDEVYSVFKKVEFNSLLLNTALSKIADREAKIEELKKKIVSDIKKEFDMIEELVKKRANELMLSAIEKANMKLEECVQNRKLLQQNLSTIQHCLKFVKCVLYTSSDPVLYYTKDLMLNRMKRLNFVTRVPCPVDVINLSFSSLDIDDTKTKIKNCGTILDCQSPGTRDNNYWSSVCAAIYTECRERWKLIEEEKKLVLEHNVPLQSEKETPDIPKEDPQELHKTEKPPELQKNSVLRQLLSVAKSNEHGGEPVTNLQNSEPQAKSHASWANFSQAKSWHIPETVKFIPKPNNDMDMGNGIKKVRLPAQNPVPQLLDQTTDYEALDQILKDLGAIEERENKEKEKSQVYQSPTSLPNDFWCSVCLGPEGLISCNNCPKVFHANCHIPAISYPVPAQWRCILCQEICALPPGSYSLFKSIDLKIAHRLLLEMFCQYEASAPFRSPPRNVSCSRIICLQDIKTKLEKRKYASILDFIRDVKYMFNYCYRYRQAEVDAITHAQSLEEIFNRLLLKFIPHFTFRAS